MSGTTRLSMRVENSVLRKEIMALTHSTLAAKSMRELKWTAGQSAELSGLGKGESRRMTVTILKLAGKRLHLGAEQPVTGGAAVRLEWDGQMVLGQVLNAHPGGFWL